MKSNFPYWVRQYRPWLIAAAGALALYALLGFFAVPRIATRALENYVRADLHRKVSVGRVSFNPFTFTARIERFSLAEADDSPIASFDDLLINAELSSIVHGAAVFKEIRLNKPHALLRIESDGSLNLAKLSPRASESNAGPASPNLPRIRIGVFALHAGRISIEDRSRPTPFSTTLAPIEFSLDHFRTEPKFDNAYRFSASTVEGERLEWAGEFTVQPLGSVGRFTLNKINAKTVAAYLQDALPFDWQSGVLDIQGDYALTLKDRVDLKIRLPLIQAQDCRIAEHAATPANPWIVTPILSLAGTTVSLAERTVSVDSLHLADASIEAWREANGTFNLVRLWGAPPTKVDSAPAMTQSASSKPWTFGVKTISIERARINAEDRSVRPVAKFTLAANLGVTDFSTSPNSVLMLDTNVGINDKGSVSVKGPITLTPLTIKAAVSVKQFDLAAIQPYLAQSTDMTLFRGLLSSAIQVDYAALPVRGKPTLKLSGNVEVDDLLTKDNALEEDFLKWQSLQIIGLNYQQDPVRLNISKVRAVKPYGRVIIASNRTLNITQVLNPKGAPDLSAVNSEIPNERASVELQLKESASVARDPMPTRIRSVVIEDGSASFADYSVKPSFATEIEELKGSIDGLSSDAASRAKVVLAGKVDRYAPVSINGEVNLLSSQTYSDIAMNFQNMELTTFNPYSGKFAGYNITKGKLSTEMRYKVQDRSLDARHHIVIDQLEFGSATDSKDAVTLPVKLAVALLKDRHGVIDLDLPVSGNIDDPTFKLGPILWQVFKNTLEKIVTAPFAMLGRLFGGGEELAYIDFDHGSAVLNQNAAAKLGTLRKAMSERPQLKLDVPMRAIDELDGIAMTRATLDRSVAEFLKSNPNRLAALVSIYTKEFGKAPASPETADKKSEDALKIKFLEEALLAKLTTTPAQIEELGRARGAAVREALLTGSDVAPDRIFLSTRDLEEKPRNEAVRMELKLE